MEKQILIELERMRSLMDLINEQGSADITDIRRGEQQLAGASDTFSPMDQYNSIKIGEGTNYPVILPGYTTQVMGNPNPILKQSGSGTKASDFIPDVKVDEKGNEYVEKNGKKYCLPDKKFWDAFNSKNYVYQIVNPRNNKKFSMKLKTKEFVEIPIIDENGKTSTQKIKGAEASIRCLGGDNGWGFDIYGGKVLFWSKEGESYNTTNPEHFDLRSDFDVWWDKWGIFVEIGVGILAAFTGAGLAANLIRLGFFAESGLAASYAAGSSQTYLSVVLQAGIEAGLMAPIAQYQWSRGKESDAILSMAFSFLPFLTELGSVQKFIRGGIQPGVSKSLQSKFLSIGGSDAISNKEVYGDFLNSLSASELMLWKASVDQFSTKEGQQMFMDGVSKYLKENEIRITNEILGNKELVDIMDDLTAGQFSKGAKLLTKINPIKGTGVLASFIRTGVPIAGIAISFTSIYNKLKSLGYDDVKIKKIVDNVKLSLDNSGFFVQLAKINSDLFSKLQEKLLVDYLSKKENSEKILNNVISSKELSSVLENQAKKIILTDPKIYDTYIKQIDIDFTKDISELDTFLKGEIITYLETNGHNNVLIDTITPLKDYKFNSDKTKNGEIKIKTNLNKISDIVKLDYNNNVEITQT